MSTKIIAIMEDEFSLLRRSKRSRESYSGVIRRVFKKKSIIDLAGAWKDVSDEEADRMKDLIKKVRSKTTVVARTVSRSMNRPVDR